MNHEHIVFSLTSTPRGPQCDTWNSEDSSNSSVAQTQAILKVTRAALLVALLLTLARVFALVLAFALVGVLSRAPVTHLLCILWAEGAVLRPAACLALPYAVRRVRHPHTLWHAILARHAERELRAKVCAIVRYR
jgi:hypothetical protein